MSREVCGICWCPYDEFTGDCACPPPNVQKSTQHEALTAIYEVWAGSEGIPEPQTACEAYLLRLIEQMRDIARDHGDSIALMTLLAREKRKSETLLEALKTVEWHGAGSCWVVDADKVAAAIKAAEEST